MLPTVPRPSPTQWPERSAKELLHFLLFIKIFFLLTGITFVTIALIGEDQICIAPYRDRQVLLSSGVSLIITSSVFLLTNILAIHGLRLWRPYLLLPHLACLLAGAMSCFFYVVKAVLIVGIQEDQGLKLAALAGCVIFSGLFLHLCPVFFLLHLPRPQPPSSPNSLELPSTIQDLELPPSCLHTSQDLPPRYDGILDSQLPSYEESIVLEEPVLDSA